MNNSAFADTLSPRAVVALSLVGTLCYLPMLLLPYEITALADEYGWGSKAAGLVVTFELLIIAATAAWLARTIDLRDKRAWTIYGVLLAGGASVASVIAPGAVAMLVCLVLTGLGCGMMAATTNALPALHPHPERVFAYVQATAAILFGCMNWAMGLLANVGRGRVFIVQFGCIALLGGGAFVLPSAISSASTDRKEKASRPKLSTAVMTTVVAVGLTWASLQALWGFAEQAALARGLSEKSLITWFMISGFVAPLGGVLAMGLGERCGYVFPLLAGFLSLICSAICMYCVGGYDAYVVGIMIFNPPITFTISYLMGLLADLDKTGRGSTVGIAATNFGGAVGPLLGVMVIQVRSLAPVGIAAAAIFVIAAALALWSVSQRRSGAQLTPPDMASEFGA
jgi:predicted MFS family arabinose efflux permease